MAAALLSACTTAPASAPSAGSRPDILLLGEQHDAAEHQRLHAHTVTALANAGRLAALAIEMADAGADTRALGPQADEAAVRAALRWSEQAWPWAPYAPAIMAAVRAGVPVVGANLPRAQMREAMRDDTLDRALSPDAMARQRDAVRDGHCGLMPEAQLGPMARIQVARDRAMAQTIAQATEQAKAGTSKKTGHPRPSRGGTVILLAGHAHVDAELGVPRHLPADLSWSAITWPAQPPKQDYCEALRQQMQGPRR